MEDFEIVNSVILGNWLLVTKRSLVEENMEWDTMETVHFAKSCYLRSVLEQSNTISFGSIEADSEYLNKYLRREKSLMDIVHDHALISSRR
jgi:hypothetical protein